MPTLTLLLFLTILTPISAHISGSQSSFAKTTITNNPFTAKATALRYWSRKVPTNTPKPLFLVSKLSPLTAIHTTTFNSLSALTSNLAEFCTAANLLCPNTSSLNQSLSSHDTPSAFKVYDDTDFSNYGTVGVGGVDSFKNYSDGENVPINTFRRYSRDSVGHSHEFMNYAQDGNVVTANFTSYASSANGGTGDFANYDTGSNVPDLKFSNYDAHSNGQSEGFTSYSVNSNAGDQSFAGYGKDGNGAVSSFISYDNESNVVGSSFAGYGEGTNDPNSSFISYGFDGNVPENFFKSYGDGANGGTHSFSSYRDQANVGDDSFVSYAKNGNGADVDFTNYGNSFNQGSDYFKGYAKGDLQLDHKIDFTSYSGDNTTFKDYAKTGVDFRTYKNGTSNSVSVSESKKLNNKWVVEPGKFFRERDLKQGTVMPMPDIRDKMASRSFLPRSISGIIPFSAEDVRRIFGIKPDTALGKAVSDTVSECARAPSAGETKKCALSAEDIIDFAVSVLGDDVVVRSTATTAGSGKRIRIGKVEGVNGGKVTKSVSCHQSLFPYMVYYCHSVPKVRVYRAEIMSADAKETINHGVAICHLDTSAWSASHGAFIALGSKPGQIEVCHWIFEGDMTWTVAD